MTAVEKKKQSTKETLFDDDNVVDVSYIIKARSLREDLSSLDLVIIKNFLRFIVVISREIIDDEQKKIIVDSMNTFVEWFFAEFARVTDNRIDEKDKCAIYDVNACSSEI